MRRRAQSAFIIAAFAAAAGWAACSSQQSASSGKDGGNDASGSGGGSGSGGVAGSGGSGGSALGGSGGAGGGAAGAGPWGAAPIWQAIPGTAAGCTFERMVNAAEVRMFKWQPCSWTSGCQEATFNTDLFGAKYGFIRTSVVSDDGVAVHVGLTMWTGHNMAIVATESGQGLEAFRAAGAAPACLIEGTSVWKDRYAVDAEDRTGTTHFGGIVGKIGGTDTAPVVFAIPEPAPVGSPQQFVLGDARWMWWWTPVDRLSTVSAQDGSDFRIFASEGGSVLHYTGLATTGPLFLAEEFNQGDGGQVQGRIAYSDGMAPMEAYLVPPDPMDDYGAPAFANSYVGFMRGINRKALNEYDAVEIWATPYSTNPTDLKPEKVGDYPYTSMSDPVGGWGRMAVVEATQIGGPFTPTIWNLATKEAKRFPALPSDHFPDPSLGVTRTHFWLGGRVKGTDPYLMRFNVE